MRIHLGLDRRFTRSHVRIFRWIWDRCVLRVVDILMALPSLLLAIVVVAVLGPSLWNALWAVTLVALPGFIRICRASVLAEREKEYVQASRAFGAGAIRHVHRHIAQLFGSDDRAGQPWL